MGSDHPSICPYGTIFATADDQLLVLAVGADSQVCLSRSAIRGGALPMVFVRVLQFRKLCVELGVPDLAQDARFVTNSARVLHRDELLNILTDL